VKLAMKRREFITLIGGAAAWPLAAHAQQAAKSYRISYLALLPSEDTTSVRDPVGAGLVASLAQPGANVTGLTSQASDIATNRADNNQGRDDVRV
jgi:hypothetical protein